MSDFTLAPFGLSLYSPRLWMMLGFGMILGSFFNVCIYRIPRQIFWSSKRSRCVSCQALIPIWLNIPLVSYIYLRGRAKCCGAKIPLSYPIVEVMAGLGLALIYLKFPFFRADTEHQIYLSELLRFVHAVIFSSFLLICAFIDLEHKIIPDVLSLPMLLISPLVVAVHPELDWISASLGALLGGGSVILINHIYFMLRGETGIGMGDAKLLAVVGSWLGYQAVLPCFFYGSILGSIFGVGAMIWNRKVHLKSEIPFGPFLGVGALMYMFLARSLQNTLFNF